MTINTSDPVINDYTLEELIVPEQIQNLLDAHQRISGMACGLMDNDENIIVASGLQEVCTGYHWDNPVAFARCWRNDAAIRDDLRRLETGMYECRCQNGMVNVAMPLVIAGRRCGTFFAGQFFYDDTQPDMAWFQGQAEELGFDPEHYLQAVCHVPVFSRTKVDDTMRFLHQLVQLLAETGHTNRVRLHLLEEQEQTEQTLQESEERFRLLVELSPDLIFIRHEEWIVYANPAAARMVGANSAEELIGKSVLDFALPERREYLKTLIAANNTRQIGEVTASYEGTLVRLDGSHLPIELTAVRFQYQGMPCSQLIMRDISKRKLTEDALTAREREFRTLAENSPDNIVRYDTACRMVYVNPQMEKTLGMSATDLLGKTPKDKKRSGEDRHSYQDKIGKVLATGEDDEIDLILPDGGDGEQYHNVRFVAERGADGAVTGVLAIGRNITERKQAEKELREKQQRLNDMALELAMSEERERCRIATELHDTLGQDLTLVRLRLGVLAKSDIPEELVRMLDTIREPLETAINRVRGLIRLISPPILESAGLEAALKWLGRQMEAEYGLLVTFSDDLQDKPLPREYQTEIYNAVRELLINVVKHAETKNAGLTVARDDRIFVVTVEDNGIGSDADIASAMGDGGFGLFNLRRRLSHFGGTVHIDSAPGTGTRVIIRMPLKPAHG